MSKVEQVEVVHGAVAQRLALGKGDAIVVTVPSFATLEQIADMRRQVEHALPGRRALFVREGVELRAVGEGELPA